MADQNFNINIRTTADTTGVKQVTSEIVKLQRQASLRGALTTVPEALKTSAPAPDIVKKLEQSEVLFERVGNRLGSRFITSFIGSFVGLAAVQAIADKLVQWGENIKKAAEEQRTLNREIDKAVRGYEDIRNLETWDKENAKIEEQIQLLRDRKKEATDPDQIQSITKEIDARERQQQNLAIQTQRGYQRARAEEDVRSAIRDQVDALADADRGAGTNLATAKARREEAEKNYKQVQDTESAQLSAKADAAKLAQESKDADEKAAKAKKDVIEAEKEARRDPGSVDVSAARERAQEAEREAQAIRDAASGAAAYVRELDKGKDALAANLALTKAITEERKNEEKAAKKREADKSAKESKELSGALGIPPQDFAKKQAAEAGQHQRERMADVQKLREAEATGDKEGAKMLEDKLKNDRFSRDQEKERLQRYSALQESIGAGPDEAITSKETGVEGLQKYKAAQERLGEIYGQERAEAGRELPRVGRKAEIGESQAGVDEMERSRLAFEQQLKGPAAKKEEQGGEAGNKGVEALLREMIRIWQ